MSKSLKERYEFSRSTKPLLLEFDEKRLKELKYITIVAQKLSVVGGKTEEALNDLIQKVTKYAGEGFGKKLLRKVWSPDNAESAGFVVNGLINAYKIIEDFLDARTDIQKKFKEGKYSNFKEFLSDVKVDEKDLFKAFKSKGAETSESSGDGPSSTRILGINAWKILKLRPEVAWQELLNVDFNKFKTIIGVSSNANTSTLTKPPSNIPGRERTTQTGDAQISPESRTAAMRIAANGFNGIGDAFRYILVTSNVDPREARSIVRKKDSKAIERAIRQQTGTNLRTFVLVTKYLTEKDLLK